MDYISTRGRAETASFTDVLLNGMAPDGGLYVPKTIPVLSKSHLERMTGTTYSTVAHEVMRSFLSTDFSDEAFELILEQVYGPDDTLFRHKTITPLTQIGPNSWLLELFHGPTLAFKDIALQLLGKLFDLILESRGEQVTIVGATSGDTGSAAIEACKNCKNINIFILHPKNRVSDVQRRQMTTVHSNNVINIAVEGTFDDCQTMVKAMFADQALREELNLSAINSINWARIMAQTVYYVSASLALGSPGRPVNFAVPTGNFGNIYAAYIARLMGLPIHNLVIGSNRNDILTRFFESGEMRAESVVPTLSPSMDIQISSNFERYLFHLLGHDSERLTDLMNDFKKNGAFKIDDALMKKAQRDFKAIRCDDEHTKQMMATCYKATGKLIDPHTAVGLWAAGSATEADPSIPTIALACAHPAKFPDAVEDATGIRPPLPPHLEALFDKAELVTPLPNDLEKLKKFIRYEVKDRR